MHCKDHNKVEESKNCLQQFAGNVKWCQIFRFLQQFASNAKWCQIVRFLRIGLGRGSKYDYIVVKYFDCNSKKKWPIQTTFWKMKTKCLTSVLTFD